MYAKLNLFSKWRVQSQDWTIQVCNILQLNGQPCKMQGHSAPLHPPQYMPPISSVRFANWLVFSWLVEPVSEVGPVLGMVTDHHWAGRWSILNRKLCNMIKAKTFLRVPSVATWYFSFKKMFSFFRSPFILKHWDMYLAFKVKMLLLN